MAIAAAGATIHGLGSSDVVGSEVAARPAIAPRPKRRYSGARQEPPESLTGTSTEPSTSPRNRARMVWGWSSTRPATGPATVSTAAAIPITSGITSTQLIARRCSRIPARRSGPMSRRRAAPVMWWPASINSS